MLDTRPRTVQGIGASIVSKLIARRRPRGYPIWGTAVVDVLVAGPPLPQNKRQIRFPRFSTSSYPPWALCIVPPEKAFLSAGIGTRLVVIQQCSCLADCNPCAGRVLTSLEHLSPQSLDYKRVARAQVHCQVGSYIVHPASRLGQQVIGLRQVSNRIEVCDALPTRLPFDFLGYGLDLRIRNNDWHLLGQWRFLVRVMHQPRQAHQQKAETEPEKLPWVRSLGVLQDSVPARSSGVPGAGNAVDLGDDVLTTLDAVTAEPVVARRAIAEPAATVAARPSIERRTDLISGSVNYLSGVSPSQGAGSTTTVQTEDAVSRAQTAPRPSPRSPPPTK